MIDETVKDDVTTIEAKNPVYAAKKVNKKSYSDDEIEAMFKERIDSHELERQADVEAKKLNVFKSAEGCIVTDHKFLMRLYNLSINGQWLKYFRNEDEVLTTDQIWERVRNSSLNRK